MTDATNLVKLTITTHLGAVYEFPDVPSHVIEEFIKSPNLHGFPSLSLANMSSACLILPTRIIATIAVEGEVRWRSLA